MDEHLDGAAAIVGVAAILPDAPDVATFFVKHMNEPPPSLRSLNPRVPQKLDELVIRMMAKSPGARPVDGHRIHQDLLDIVKEQEIVAPPNADEEPARRERAARGVDGRCPG